LGIKLTTDEWIARAKTIWGDEYDYSKSFYRGRKERIEIICKSCGPILVPAGNHIQQNRKPTGCNSCNRAKAAKGLTKPFKTMVKDARAIHGDRYEYIKDSYVSARVGMTIVCPIHGKVTITPDSHINGKHGCKPCADNKRAKDTLAARYSILAKRISKISDGSVRLFFLGFKGQNFDAIFECKKHGKFSRKPIAALETRHPCQRCMEQLPNSNTLLSEDKIRERVVSFLGSFRVDQIMGLGKKAKIYLTCLEEASHNPLPATNLDALYRRDYACSKCGSKAGQPARTAGVVESVRKSLHRRAKKWQVQAAKFHNNKFDYSLADYNDAHGEVIIICPIHGAFPQIAGTHLTRGCRACADEELKGRYSHTYFVRNPEEKSKPACIYHVVFDFFGRDLFKVGITTTSIKNRFSAASGQGISHQVVAYSEMSLYRAFQTEQLLLQRCEKTIQNLLTEEECAKLKEAKIGITELVDKKLNHLQLLEYF